MNKAKFGWRLTAVWVAAAAVTAAGPLTPALAATGPSITANHGAVNIAVQGPHNSLLFYWATNGSSTWHSETVASAVNNSAGPSITSNGNAANISDVNSTGDLMFYWAADGTSTWHAEPVPGNGTGPHA